ncbi:MAG: ATP synthase F1 subunit epsilon [Lachnospiraceae bacterium]|nr:ATP synthase F1 subunit epsilon [Lachnospiraceae bacterium]
MSDFFTLKIITPERLFYEGQVTMAEFTTEEGNVGVLKGHEAMTYLIAPGVLRIHEESGIKKAALHVGFAEILPDEVRILAQIAEWPDEIDLNRANEAKIRAERAIREDGSTLQEELALRRAIARIETLKD